MAIKLATRQQTLINLGRLEGLSKENHKLLADRIESLLTGAVPQLFDVPHEIEVLAQKFASKITEKGIFPQRKTARPISRDIETDYQEVDINSIEQLDSKTIGGEWLVKQAFNKFGLTDLFSCTGMSDNEAGIAKILLTAKMIHPSSELETQRWIEENSGIGELYNLEDNHPVTRYRLYKAATHLYKHKDDIERQLYAASQNLFSQKSAIVILQYSVNFSTGNFT